MEITRRILFENERLQIGRFEARFVSDTRFDVEREEGSDALVLPFSGVFSRHDGPGRYVVGTPSHAVLFTANTPYRIGFPGAIGDRALTLRFGQGLARERSGNHDDVTSHGLLSAKAILLRNLLRRRLETGAADAFEVETLALELVHLSLKSMRRNTQAVGLPALARRKRALERVKEAVAGCAVRQVERCQAGEGGEPFAISPLPCFSGDRRHLPLQLCSAGAPRGGAGRSSRRGGGYHRDCNERGVPQPQPLHRTVSAIFRLLTGGTSKRANSLSISPNSARS